MIRRVSIRGGSVEHERPAEVDRAHRSDQMAGRVQHERASRLDALNREEHGPIRTVRNAIADIEMLEVGANVLGAPLADTPLQAIEPMRRVPPGAELGISHLNDPRPDLARAGVDRDRARRLPHRILDDLITRQHGSDLSAGGAGTPANTARGAHCREGDGRRNPPTAAKLHAAKLRRCRRVRHPRQHARTLRIDRITPSRTRGCRHDTHRASCLHERHSQAFARVVRGTGLCHLVGLDGPPPACRSRRREGRRLADSSAGAARPCRRRSRSHGAGLWSRGCS